MDPEVSKGGTNEKFHNDIVFLSVTHVDFYMYILPLKKYYCVTEKEMKSKVNIVEGWLKLRISLPGGGGG